jgi:intracellular septation protein
MSPPDTTPAAQPGAKPAAKPSQTPWVRMAIDYAGPAAFMLGFFLTHKILLGTWALVIVSGLALLVGFVIERRVAISPLIWGLAALVFGVLTIVFKDERIIKMKTTFIDAALGAFMLGGWAIGKSPIKLLMGQTIALTDAGWRRLTFRFGLFFLVMGAANEIIWRTQPDAVWVAFRFPGLLILSLLFSATQIPGMMKDAQAAEAAVRLVETQE